MDGNIPTRSPNPSLGLARLVLGALVAAVLVWQLSDVILLIFFAVLLAVALRGPADAAARLLRLPPAAALTGLVLLLLLLAVGTIWWIAPHIAAQLGDLFTRLRSDLHLLEARFRGAPWASGALSQLEQLSFSDLPVANSAQFVAGTSFATLAGLVLVAVTALYMASSPGPYLAGAVKLAPPAHRARLRAVLEETGSMLRWWMLGQLIDMFAVGALAAAGLSIAGVPAAMALALIAGLATFVPYVGAILSAVPAILVAFTVDWRLALWVVAIFLLCHVVEGYVVGPLVQRRMVDLPPAVSILSMTVMSTLFGTLGIVLASPIAAAGLVLVRRLYVEDVLGDTAD